MRLKKIEIRDFGPFSKYSIDFTVDDACILLTGKNNEGKTSILNSIKLIEASLRVVKKKKYQIILNGSTYYSLQKQDTEGYILERLIHNYEETVAEITAVFDDEFTIVCYIDPYEKLIYSNCMGKIPDDIDEIFGIIPALGPLSEREEVLTNLSYIKANFRTTLAPRHFRNILHQIISNDEYKIIKKIISDSWEKIELEDIEYDYNSKTISVFYREDRLLREVSWAGQGLQIWFQIITHLVRLQHSKILILDEPEINLHPEKQNDLISVLRQYFDGSILIATHSVELMNNVNISHILNINKSQKSPKIHTTLNRAYLDTVRSEIGSNFNLIASQFEDVELIIFTEDKYDYKLISLLSNIYGYNKRTHNIPIHGFQEYTKTIAYKEAYELLIGKGRYFVCVLDRDYYPESYLLKVKDKLEKHSIRVIYTPGKEIENILINDTLLKSFVSVEVHRSINNNMEKWFKEEFNDAYGSYITLMQKYGKSAVDVKTIIKEYGDTFSRQWKEDKLDRTLCPGKNILKRIRKLYKEITKENLLDEELLKCYSSIDLRMVQRWIESIYA